MTYSYRCNGCLRIEFDFAGYDCEIELDCKGITTVAVDSHHGFEFTSEMTLHELQQIVMQDLLASRAAKNAWYAARGLFPTS